MEKSLVIRWVVPLIVMTPATATSSQVSATSALWRSTKRVSACISGLPLHRSPAACPPATASVPPRRVLARPAEVVSACYPWASTEGPHPVPTYCGGSSRRTSLADGERGEIG